MNTKFNILMVLVLAAALVGGNTGVAQAAISPYVAAGSVNVAPASPTLTAVDPLAWAVSADVIPARPFLYSVDSTGITITRFNDNTVVGRWPWPTDVIYTVLPDGSYTGLTPPAAWEPVAMMVSYPTEGELANRVKEIPDLTPPPTFVYVVMAHSGYEWHSNFGFRDTIVESTNPDTDSSMLIQIDVSDPSFSAAVDPTNPVPPHIAGALLGHNAGQPVYDRSNGNVYVGNMPSNSLPAGLQEFVSVIRRIPDTVAEVEAEIPGISMPVIRCGPQHPESGIPVGKPQAFACYDPGGVHPINDNEHVGAAGEFEWEFRNLPDWLMAHNGVLGLDGVVRESDGILYGTPPAVGDWIAEARVHDLEDPYGIFSDWHPVRLLVTPSAEYLPIKAEFAAGVPVAYPLEGTGSCALSGAPAWVEVQTVPNGCIVMGTAPLDGEYYNFTMPGLTVAGYPDLSLVFSGNVFGEYGFVPLPAGVGLTGLAWHQVSKVPDPSTETAVLSLEFIGVDPSTGQMYQILPPPGQPQPPNDRPPKTALTLDVVSEEGTPLAGTAFGNVAVEADRDIYVAAGNAVIKVSGGTATSISLPSGMQASSLSLDSDLRTAIPGVEPGQVDHGALWAAGAGGAAVIDTDAGSVAQSFDVSGASSASVDFATRYAYVANGSGSVAIFAPAMFDPPIATPRPAMEPRIWSAEEFTWNLGQTAEVRLMATGDPLPSLVLLGTLPDGMFFEDLGGGIARVYGTPKIGGTGGHCGGPEGEGDPEGGEPCGDYAFALTAANSQGVYAQSFGLTVQTAPVINEPFSATFYTGASNSFTVTGTGYPEPVFYIWDETLLPPGIQLIDNENGTASLVGTPETAGVYTFPIYATTGFPPDAEQTFTLTVVDGPSAPVINSGDTVTWPAVGAPFSPDPFTITSAGSPTPVLTVEGTLPPGITFIDNGDSTGMLGAACQSAWPGMSPECLGLLPDGLQGVYTFNIRASNGVQPDAIQTFTLNLERATSLLGAAPGVLSFVTDGTYVPSQLISLTTTGDVLPYTLVTTASWLKATPESGTMPGSMTVSADATGLVPGTYTGTVIIGSAGTEGGPATVTVTLTVVGILDPGMVGVSPGALRFNYKVNSGAMPPAQTVWVMSGGEELNYTVSTGGAKWLSAPAGGTAPGGFRVYVDPRVGVGMHVANLTIDAAGALNGPQTVLVTLVKTAGDRDLVQVMFDVGSGPEGLAANLNTHNLFISSSSGIAEAAEAGGASDSGVELPGPPEPSLVFHINPVDKTLVGETVVHSEAEYIGVNSKTGRAYHASEGTSEIAVIDGSTNTAIAFIPLIITESIPLIIDKGPTIPYQIAIDEAQNFIYVGAKSPEPEGKSPNPLIKDANGKYGCKVIRELPSDEAPAGQEEFDCWHAGVVFVIDGNTNKVVTYFLAGDDPEGVVFAKATGKVYASNEDDGSITVAKGAKRNTNGTITPPQVLGTIIHGKLVSGWWQPTCDANNNCGQRGVADLWPTASACYGIDDEAEEADKMAVDPAGNVYIIDDRYRVAKINGSTGKVDKVLAIPGYDCERTIPDGTEVVLRNTANNIAYMALGQGKLYVISEQNTVTLIDPRYMTIKATLTIPGAVELDAATTDPALNQVYITDEGQPSLWILKGACANGTGNTCVP